MVNTSLHSGKNNPGLNPAGNPAPEPTVIRPSGPKPNFEVRVSFFIIIALILLSIGYGWLKSFSLFHPPQRFTVFFHDVEGLNTNATVNTNGVRVGIVEKIELKKNLVYVHLKINTEDVRIPEHSRFTIQTLGMVGAKYVEITIPQEALSDATSVDAPVKTHMLSEQDAPQPGEDPVRMELYISGIASQIGNLDIKGIENRVKSSLDAIKATSEKYGAAAPQLSEAAKGLNRVANKADSAVGSAGRFFDKGTTSLDSITAMTGDFRTTAQRANKILANPYMSQDLRKTAEQVRIASENIHNAMSQLNQTVGDEKVRTDLRGMLERMQTSTENISKSMQLVNRVANDQGLRSDIKEIVTKANTAIDKVNSVVDQPQFGGDLLKTMTQVRTTAADVDKAAIQINETISQPHWLRKALLFGGKVKTKTVTKDKHGNKKVTTEETTHVPAGDAKASGDSKSDLKTDAKSDAKIDEKADAKSDGKSDSSK
jgi:ABC-type transporter Mla subunit MlaD